MSLSAKGILVFCAQALFVQLAVSACAGNPNLNAGLSSYGLGVITPGLGASGCVGPVLPTPGCSGLGYNGIGYGNSGIGYGAGASCGDLAIEVVPTSGGSLIVSSSSLTSPIGLSVVSENIFEGTLYVDGELPFASAVTLESVVPSAGAGAVSYSLGNGVTTIESIAPLAAAAIAPITPAYGSGIGTYGAGIGSCGAGIGAYGAGIAPLSLLPGPGCNAPIVDIVAPSNGCYPGGIYY